MKTTTTLSIALAVTLGFTSAALAGDAKAPTPPAAPAKAEPKKEAPKKMEAPKPPQELADMAKAMAGNWKCTGKAVQDPMKPTEMTDMKMTVKMALDMGGWWIKSTMDAGAMFKGEEYVTYDSAAKKYISMMRDSMGASETKTSMGMKDGKIVWEGDARATGMAMKSRATSDMSDAKAGVKMMGEYSMDGGKTFMKVWEATCKK